MPPTLPEIVQAYCDQGWQPVRIPPLSKRPVERDWPDIAYTPDRFAVGDNVGIKLGTPSGGLVDVDLDCMEAVRLAPLFLPPTATFGRPSKPRSHWIYRSPIPRTRKPARSKIELRSTGGQTVFPGSVHETGEPIEWNDWHGGPLVIEAEALTAAWAKLGMATILACVWPEIQRHHDAHHSVLALAGALWHAGWTEDEAARLILPAAELHGGPDTGHRAAAIADTFADHDRNRYGWPTVVDLIGPVDTRALERLSEEIPTVPRGATTTDDVGPLTDLGNAERFALDHSASLRAVRGIGWLQWTGTRWEDGYEPMNLIARSVRKLGRMGVERRDGRLVKWAAKSESAGKLTAIETLAGKLDQRTRADQLDADPWLLNTPTGTLDLRTGQLRVHDPLDLCTKITGCDYQAGAECPRFVQFLMEIFAGDVDVVAYMLRYLGASLTGITRDQVFQVWYGEGANGKSTLLEVMLHVLGDYAQKMSPGVLTGRRNHTGEAPSPNIVRLRGVRFAAGAEVEEDTRWNEALVKELTGNETITARRLHAHPVEFPPTWKIALAVNHKPTVRGTDHGIWRRIHLVPFAVKFDGPRLDATLLDRLITHEAPGILALLVRGCQEWQRVGLAPPAAVQAAVQAYRQGQDTIGEFLEECTSEDQSSTVARAAVYRSYRTWAIDSGLDPLSKQKFTRVLEERGYHTRKTGGHVVWSGFRLRNPEF